MTGGRRTHRRDVVLVSLVALVARLAVVAWGASFPPAADGAYYHRLAVRLAEGHGYTWAWPDGVVTAAAHYPVGYPAMVAVGYAIFGARPVVAMVLNALFGAAAAGATTDLLRGATSRRLGIAAGIVMALHPALLAYTPALMTEGITAALLVTAAAGARRTGESEGRRRVGALMAVGAVVGIATLVRPQSLAMAPLLGVIAGWGWGVGRGRGSDANRGWSTGSGIFSALLVTAAAICVCLPWTARNCVRMEKCALVSVNGGWNLAIGAQTDTGAWQELAVPEPCREVFAEAAKDACFGREARKAIVTDPLTWLRRAPAKLRVTFEYFGGAPWYLHESDRVRFPWNAKVALGTVETVVSRALLAAALVAAARWPGARRRARIAIAAVGFVAALSVAGTLGYVALAVVLLLLGGRALLSGPTVLGATLAALAVTFAVHAVFFGAGRYGLVVVPFVVALAFAHPPARAGDGLTTNERPP